VVVVVIAVALIGGGAFLLTQGGDDRSEEEQAYIDAIAETGLANQGGDDLRLDENEARCLATAVVDTFGVETLRDEASPEEIRANPEDDPLEDIDVGLPQAEGLYDSTSGCIDYRGLLVVSLQEDSGLSPEQIDCVNRSLSDQHIRELLVAQFAQDVDAGEEAGNAADEATEDCNLPE
jgi:hypothetical protein